MTGTSGTTACAAERRGADVCAARRTRAVALLAALLAMPLGRARAEPSPEDKALATTLFQEGRSLMSAGRFTDACAKLAESQRLDPSGGTLLNLALCHEQEGRFASSWSAFNEAAAVARRDGRRDREQEALTHVRALEPRLSRLTIVVPAGTEVEGLRIERDGREIGRGAWSTAMPIDGGGHVVRATATGRDPYVTTVAMNKEGDAKTVEIPALATAVVLVTPAQAEAPVLVSPPHPPLSASTAKRLRWGGIATGSVGVALLGVATYALFMALDEKDASKADCSPDGCGDVGLAHSARGERLGQWATALSISGVVLVGAGGALYYVGRRADRARAAQRDLHLTLGAAPGMVVTGIAGRF